MMIRRWIPIALLLSLFLWSGSPLRGEGRVAVEGIWEGAIVYTAAEQEVDFTVHLFLDARGVLAGLVDIPTKPIEGEPLGGLRLDGSNLSWELVRDSGTFPFSGTVAADGGEIRGTCSDRGRTVDFWLRRRDPAAPEPARVSPPVLSLAANGAELKERFNADTGKVRLVMLLSPG